MALKGNITNQTFEDFIVRSSEPQIRSLGIWNEVFDPQGDQS